MEEEKCLECCVVVRRVFLPSQTFLVLGEDILSGFPYLNLVVFGIAFGR